MKKHPLLKRATAAALLTATLAAPGVVGLTAATASARAMSEAQCVALENEMGYYKMRMGDAQRANNKSEYRYWAKNYDNAQVVYSRGC